MFGKKNSTVEIVISNRTILRIILLGVGTVLLFRFIENVLHPLTLIFISFFLSLALNPAVSWVSKHLRSKSRVGATAIAYGIVISLLVVFLMLVVPPLISQTTEFIRDVPATLSGLQSQDSALGTFIRRYDLEHQIQNFGSDWTRNLGSLHGPVLTTANRVLANVVSIITVLVLTFMMLVEGPRWRDAFWRHVPAHKRAHFKVLAGRMYKVVTSYVNGQVIVAATGSLSAMVFITLFSTLYHVSINAIALGGIVFLFALIPTIGNIIGASTVALFALFVSPPLAATLLVYFIVYQQLENATLQPYIQSRTNELTPMLVFIAAILGIGFGGVLGGFVAIPFAGCAKVLVDDWLDERAPTAEPPSNDVTLA